MSKRRELKAPATVTVRISADLRSRLEALEPAGRVRSCLYSEEQKMALLEYWPKKNHRALCRELEMGYTTALRWYKIWTQKS